MKILVIDDTSINNKAARAQLKDHDLKTASDCMDIHQGAQKLLGGDGYGKRGSKSHDYDVVLVDLELPASDRNERLKGAGTLMPIGMMLALLACKNGKKGVKVAVLTDASHHSDIMSAGIDQFNEYENAPEIFPCGNGTIMLTNNRFWIGPFEESDMTKQLDWGEIDGKATVKAKNWGKLLEYLMKEGG